MKYSDRSFAVELSSENLFDVVALGTKASYLGLKPKKCEKKFFQQFFVMKL